MKALLGIVNYLEVKGYKKPENEEVLTALQRNSLRESRKKESKTLYLIYQVVEELAFEKISKVTTSKQTCGILLTPIREWRR